MARETLAGLRKRIATLEGRMTDDARLQIPGPRTHGRFGNLGDIPDSTRSLGILPFGIDRLDASFAKGGLAVDTLHEVIGRETRGAGAASGFATALAARLLKRHEGMLLWVCDPQLRQEAGRLNAEGLYQFGLDPARVLIVSPPAGEDGLWAMEEGLGNRAVTIVIGEFHHTHRALHLTATRRLALRAQRQNTMALLVRHGTHADPSAAQTRWTVQPGLSNTLGGFDVGPGRPRWQIDLDKNRDGRTGTFTLEWDHAQSCFHDAPLSVALAAAPADGQDRPAAMGQVVALRQAG